MKHVLVVFLVAFSICTLITRVKGATEDSVPKNPDEQNCVWANDKYCKKDCAKNALFMSIKDACNPPTCKC
ncbi:hypothetical protein C0J52_20461 [Blattella germanica]|nr:hypothetical protein C0J52_20461 [Blattella germanica]